MKGSLISLLRPLDGKDRFLLVTPLLLVSEDSAVDDPVAGSVAVSQISESNALLFLRDSAVHRSKAE